MARHPRLIIAGLPHIVCQRVQHGQTMLVDESDRSAFLSLLTELAAQTHVAIHAYSVQDTRFDLVLTPADAPALSRLMQALSRRHAVTFNARHGRRGALWEGRFRSAVVEPDTWLLPCMLAVDSVAAGAPPGRERSLTSLSAHVGGSSERVLSPPDVYWLLGNTPFEREANYREMVERGLTSEQNAAIEAALRGGWPLGSRRFIEGLEDRIGRPTQPGARGRPRRAATAP